MCITSSQLSDSPATPRLHFLPHAQPIILANGQETIADRAAFVRVYVCVCACGVCAIYNLNMSVPVKSEEVTSQTSGRCRLHSVC